jgi:hypothetical protein
MVTTLYFLGKSFNILSKISWVKTTRWFFFSFTLPLFHCTKKKKEQVVRRMANTAERNERGNGEENEEGNNPATQHTEKKARNKRKPERRGEGRKEREREKRTNERKKAKKHTFFLPLPLLEEAAARALASFDF